MTNIVRALIVLCFITVLAPSAFAFEPDRDYAPSDPCGSIDPDRACYLPLGTRDCPARTSYRTCMSRCECQFENNKKRCGTSTPCVSLALSERNACYGACASDFS